MRFVTFFALCIALSGTTKAEPAWLKVKKLREFQNARLGRVLSDIESHMPEGHDYSFAGQPMTWSHETTHGLNGRLRMVFRGKGKNYLYCLDSKCVEITEPSCSLRDVAMSIPPSLRGPSYHLYMVQQGRYWNDTPSYVLDEWLAYTHGVMTGMAVDEDGWYYELLQANNFTVYSIAMAMAVSSRDPNYDHTQLREFLAWNIQRINKIMEGIESQPQQGKLGQNATPRQRSDEYRNYLQKSPDADKLREFARSYFGAEWTLANLGF